MNSASQHEKTDKTKTTSETVRQMEEWMQGVIEVASDKAGQEREMLKTWTTDKVPDRETSKPIKSILQRALQHRQ